MPKKKKAIQSGNGFLFKVVRFFIGIAILPSAMAVCASFLQLIIPYMKDSGLVKPAVVGVLLYGLIAYAGRKSRNTSNRLYVAAHEFSHALTALLFGGKVLGIKIKKTHGEVMLSKSNFVIGLAPYFLPLYAWIVVIAYFIANHFFPYAGIKPWFMAAIGFFLSFHFIHTADILSGPLQPDLEEEGGRFFSYPVIIIFFCMSVLAIFALMSPGTHSLGEAAKVFASDQKIFYQKAFYLLKYIYYNLSRFIASR